MSQWASGASVSIFRRLWRPWIASPFQPPIIQSTEWFHRTTFIDKALFLPPEDQPAFDHD